MLHNQCDHLNLANKAGAAEAFKEVVRQQSVAAPSSSAATRLLFQNHMIVTDMLSKASSATRRDDICYWDKGYAERCTPGKSLRSWTPFMLPDAYCVLHNEYTSLAVLFGDWQGMDDAKSSHDWLPFDVVQALHQDLPEGMYQQGCTQNKAQMATCNDGDYHWKRCNSERPEPYLVPSDVKDARDIAFKRLHVYWAKGIPQQHEWVRSLLIIVEEPKDMSAITGFQAVFSGLHWSETDLRQA
jgi:hypothetical protein